MTENKQERSCDSCGTPNCSGYRQCNGVSSSLTLPLWQPKEQSKQDTEIRAEYPDMVITSDTEDCQDLGKGYAVRFYDSKDFKSTKEGHIGSAFFLTQAEADEISRRVNYYQEHQKTINLYPKVKELIENELYRISHSINDMCFKTSVRIATEKHILQSILSKIKELEEKQ